LLHLLSDTRHPDANLDSQTTTSTTTKDAMSRALGAAFLNHQVEQLEKTVQGNWRDRDRERGGAQLQIAGGVKTRVVGGKGERKRAAGLNVDADRGQDVWKDRRSRAERPAERFRDGKEAEKKQHKDADVVVVDVSVLVHALYKVRNWCREDRKEVVIVPLEGPSHHLRSAAALNSTYVHKALNTLDLLKKGTSPLAQRARAASRLLEAQVGTNPRIRVQRDDAYLLWDEIAMVEGDDGSVNDSGQRAEKLKEASPEWVRRTVCCAKWEVDHAKDSLDKSKAATSPTALLAVLHPPFMNTGVANAATLAPPHHALRASGGLVAYWARRAGIGLLEVAPTAGKSDDDRDNHAEEYRVKRNSDGRGPRTNAGSGTALGPGSVGAANKGHGHGGKPGGGKSLVERPPTVIAMMEPNRPVIRVLARGEKLDNGP
jgi:hypothetical protein